MIEVEASEPNCASSKRQMFLLKANSSFHPKKVKNQSTKETSTRSEKPEKRNL